MLPIKKQTKRNYTRRSKRNKSRKEKLPRGRSSLFLSSHSRNCLHYFPLWNKDPLPYLPQNLCFTFSANTPRSFRPQNFSTPNRIDHRPTTPTFLQAKLVLGPSSPDIWKQAQMIYIRSIGPTLKHGTRMIHAVDPHIRSRSRVTTQAYICNPLRDRQTHPHHLTLADPTESILSLPPVPPPSSGYISLHLFTHDTLEISYRERWTGRITREGKHTHTPFLQFSTTCEGAIGNPVYPTNYLPEEKAPWNHPNTVTHRTMPSCQLIWREPIFRSKRAGALAPPPVPPNRLSPPSQWEREVRRRVFGVLSTRRDVTSHPF